jgi:hypothetical protein
MCSKKFSKSLCMVVCDTAPFYAVGLCGRDVYPSLSGQLYPLSFFWRHPHRHPSLSLIFVRDPWWLFQKTKRTTRVATLIITWCRQITMIRSVDSVETVFTTFHIIKYIYRRETKIARYERHYGYYGQRFHITLLYLIICSHHTKRSKVFLFLELCWKYLFTQKKNIITAAFLFKAKKWSGSFTSIGDQIRADKTMLKQGDFSYMFEVC